MFFTEGDDDQEELKACQLDRYSDQHSEHLIEKECPLYKYLKVPQAAEED